jgi:hypothetical protein
MEVRVSRITNAGVELLLYKDSRCDMRILDETVGAENWCTDFREIKGTLFGGIGIRCDGEWVWKWNAGTPSNMEAQKGEASDALKRAGFTWGIGRELYTAPRIFVYADKCDRITQGKNGKPQCYDQFGVAKVLIEDGRIKGIRIVNESNGKVAFSWKEG